MWCWKPPQQTIKIWKILFTRSPRKALAGSRWRLPKYRYRTCSKTSLLPRSNRLGMSGMSKSLVARSEVQFWNGWTGTGRRGGRLHKCRSVEKVLESNSSLWSSRGLLLTRRRSAKLTASINLLLFPTQSSKSQQKSLPTIKSKRQTTKYSVIAPFFVIVWDFSETRFHYRRKRLLRIRRRQQNWGNWKKRTNRNASKRWKSSEGRSIRSYWTERVPSGGSRTDEREPSG